MIGTFLNSMWDSRVRWLAFVAGVVAGSLWGCPTGPLDTSAVVEHAATEPEDLLTSEPEPELITIPVVDPPTL